MTPPAAQTVVENFKAHMAMTKAWWLQSTTSSITRSYFLFCKQLYVYIYPLMICILFHNIIQLFGCISWDHVLCEHEFLLILGFYVSWGALRLCTIDFSTSNCELSGFFFFIYVGSFFGKETIIWLLNDVMSRPLGLTTSMAMYHSNIGVQPGGLFRWTKDCLIELANANHMDLHFQVYGIRWKMPSYSRSDWRLYSC